MQQLAIQDMSRIFSSKVFLLIGVLAMLLGSFTFTALSNEALASNTGGARILLAQADPDDPADDAEEEEEEEEEGGIKEAILGTIGAVITFIFSLVQSVIVIIGMWVLWFVSLLLGMVIGASRFITHPFVETGWPFVLGFANLGFLLALLFIAFATVLRLEGFGVRRMLPRLLIAALLINFSLIIAGVLVDGSRIIMAVMVTLLGGVDQISNIGPAILEKSKVLEAVFYTDNSWGALPRGLYDQSKNNGIIAAVSNVFLASFFVWGLAIALLVITFGFLVRYIALLLLLIFSPIAYLAMAWPNADWLVKWWWKTFLKYLAYGPIALFVLVLLTSFANSAQEAMTGGVQAIGPVGDDDWESVRLALSNGINAIITMALLFAAATAGKKIGVAGSDKAVSVAQGAAKRAGRVGAATTGAPWVGRRIRDFGREVTRPVRRGFEIGEYSKYGKDGTLKKGKETLGSKAGSFVGRPLDRKNNRDLRNIRDNIGTPGAIPMDALKNKEAAKRLTAAEADNVFTNVNNSGDTIATVNALNNVEIVRKMSDAGRREVLNSGNRQYISALNASLKKIDEENKDN